PPPRSAVVPYTTLFRSGAPLCAEGTVELHLPNKIPRFLYMNQPPDHPFKGKGRPRSDLKHLHGYITARHRSRKISLPPNPLYFTILSVPAKERASANISRSLDNSPGIGLLVRHTSGGMFI